MQKRSGLFSRLMAVGVGATLSKLTSFFLMPLYTARLSPEAFGMADMLINTALLLIPVAAFGAPETLFRFVAGGERESDGLSVGNAFLGLGALLLILLLPLLSLFERVRPFLALLFFYVLAAVLHSYLAHLLRARGEYGLYAIQQIFCAFCTATLGFLLLAVLELGVSGYLLAILLADGITALILLGYLKPKPARRIGGEGHRLLFPMLKYALPLIPTSLLWWLLSVADRYILFYTWGERANGLLAAASRIPSLLSFAAFVFVEAWHFSAIRASESERTALFETIYALLLPALALFSFLLILCSRFLVDHLFASGFAEASGLVPLLVIGAFFSALSAFLGSVYSVHLRSGVTLLTTAIAAGAGLFLGLLLIPRQGALGAAVATLGASATLFFCRSALARRMIRFKQHGLKLLLSVSGLLLSALLSQKGMTLAVCLCAFPVLLPFFREFCEAARLFFTYFQKIRSYLTKRRRES